MKDSVLTEILSLELTGTGLGNLESKITLHTNHIQVRQFL